MADLPRKKIGEGQEAEVFLLGDDRVVKLFKGETYAEKSRREAELLSSLNAYGVAAPKYHGQITLDGMPGYIMEYIPGCSLLDYFMSHSLQCGKIARRFASIQVDVNMTQPPEGFEDETNSVRWCVEHSNLPQKYIQFGLSVLESLRKGNDLCHGDYNLANVLINANDEPVLIDWGGAAKGNYVSDVANATLMIMNGGTPPEMDRLTKIMIAFMRRTFERKYLRHYRRLRPFTKRELHDWQVVRAIGRMAYCVEGEKRNLLAFIDRCQKHPAKNYIF